MVAFQEALNRKYAIQQQEANTRQTQGAAEAALYNARASNVPTEGAINLANAQKLRTEAQLAPMTAEAQAGYYKGLGSQAQAQAGLFGAQTDLAHADLTPSAGVNSILRDFRNFMLQNQRAGQVPGLPTAPAGRDFFSDLPPGNQPQSNTTYATSDGGYAAPGQPTQYRQPVATDQNVPAGAKAVSADAPLPSNFHAAPAGWSVPADAGNRLYAPSPAGGPYIPTLDELKQPRGGLLPGGVSLSADGGGRFGGGSGLGVTGEAIESYDPNNPTKKRQAYSKGTARVPGKGPSNVDSVKADLAPNEAVLNEGAADHLGRHTIDLLNALGAHKMALAGMAPQAKGAPDPKGKKGYAKGTSRVAC